MALLTELGRGHESEGGSRRAEVGGQGTSRGAVCGRRRVRGCRVARPPATFWQPAGLAGKREQQKMNDEMRPKYF